MERLKGGVLITPKDIEIITGLCASRATKEHQATRDALGKKTKRLTVQEYCDYQQFNVEEIIAYLNQYR